MTEIITPIAVNASWFAALKGVVCQGTVYANPPGEPNPGALWIYTGDSDIVPPEGAKAGDKFWVASSPSVEGLTGVGVTPAEAIAGFNRGMVGA